MIEVAASPPEARRKLNATATVFRETEIGLIPDDWDSVPLGSVAQLINGRGFKPHEWGTRGKPIIRIQNLNGSDEFNYYDGQYNPKIEVKSGQLLFAWSGSRGTSFGPHFWSGPTAVLNYHTWKIVHRPEKITGDFLLHALRGLTEVIEAQAHGASALVHVQKWEMEGFQIPLPPLPEQDAIAGALSDADAAIRALERLIEKKRAVKQAALHALLTPTTRLHGFTGEWETKTLGASAMLKARIGWQGLTTEEYLSSGDFGLVTGTDFESGKVDWARTVFVEKARYDQDKHIQLRIGDVLITKDGTIGKSAFIHELPHPATLNSGVFVVRPKDRAFDPEFFYHVLTSFVFDEFLNRLSAGSTINHLYQKDFVSFVFPSPSLSEQRAIAAVLSDMDADITALEARRDKLKTIKHGMMQALLTGKVRLL